MLRYRINQSTLALVRQEEGYTTQTVAAGAIVTIIDGEPLNEDKLIKVIWGEARVMMYAQDLRTCCTLVAADQIPSQPLRKQVVARFEN